MPNPIETNRDVITDLNPMMGKRNEQGNGHVFPVYFNLPGPADLIECDRFPLPFDVRFHRMAIRWRVGGGGSTLVIHGLEDVGCDGPYTGNVSPRDMRSTGVSTMGTLVYPEIITADEDDEGVVIVLVGMPVDGQ